jgi:tetratricopeptide (TPR) repeat protein
MKFGTSLCVIAMATAPALATPLPGPPPEVKDAAKVDLPAVPDFAIARSAGDVHDAKELIAMGPAYFGTDVQVRGYVIWIYDCIADVRKPGESKAAAQQRIDEDPTLCERPKLYLGSQKTTPLERGLWVVDVPRPPNKLEKERLPAEKLAAWPKVPRIKVGDYVTITGHFTQRSPHDERNSDGLVVFASVAPARRTKASKPVAMPLHATAAPAIPKPPAERPVTASARSSSIRLVNEGNRVLPQQFKEALAKYDEALKLWPGNALAAYGAGLASIELHDYTRAKTYLDQSVALMPDQAMFELWDGIAGYETTFNAARTSQGADPPDLSKADLSDARTHIELALAIEPRLWRAHYYLGRIWRAKGAARDAAGEFTKAIQNNPSEWGPYVALSELYRKWEYPDLAIEVAELGTRNVRDGVDDLFFVVGLAHEDKGEEAKAIDAYTLALAANAHHAKVRFQRGQAYFRTKNYAKAKADLEAFMQDKDAVGFARTQANQLLADMADKKR